MRADFMGAEPIISGMHLEGFHPTIQRWFTQRFGEPTEPQCQGWPRIRSGKHTLISAPTGTGKTIAGYLSAIDSLAHQGKELKDQTQVLYLSPLRARVRGWSSVERAETRPKPTTQRTAECVDAV